MNENLQTAADWSKAHEAAMKAQARTMDLRSVIEGQRPAFRVHRCEKDIRIAYVTNHGNLMFDGSEQVLDEGEVIALRRWLDETFPTASGPQLVRDYEPRSPEGSRA